MMNDKSFNREQMARISLFLKKKRLLIEEERRETTMKELNAFNLV